MCVGYPKSTAVRKIYLSANKVLGWIWWPFPAGTNDGGEWPTITLEKERIKIGCYTVTRDAWVHLTNEWDAYLNKGDGKILQ